LVDVGRDSPPHPWAQLKASSPKVAMPITHQTNTKQRSNKDYVFCSLFVWSQIPTNGTGYAQCGHKPNKHLDRIVLTAP
jgi:hypothetical protein